MAGKDLVESLKRFRVEFDCGGANGALQLFHRARTDDRRRYNRIVQQPGQGNRIPPPVSIPLSGFVAIIQANGSIYPRGQCVPGG
jgi:hypothetical protein